MIIFGSLAFISIIFKTTRITDNSCSLIDNIFANNQNYLKSGISMFDVSVKTIFTLYRDFFSEIYHTETIQHRLLNGSSVKSLIFNLSSKSYDEVINNCDIVMEEPGEIKSFEFNVCCAAQLKLKKI